MVVYGLIFHSTSQHIRSPFNTCPLHVVQCSRDFHAGGGLISGLAFYDTMQRNSFPH